MLTSWTSSLSGRETGGREEMGKHFQRVVSKRSLSDQSGLLNTKKEEQIKKQRSIKLLSPLTFLFS